MSSVEERNLERLKHWEWAWNNDVMRMVDECYAESCEIIDVRRNRTYYGRKEMKLLEEQVLAVDDSRNMTAVNFIASGAQVAVETETIWDGKHISRSSTFLTFDDQGFIVKERYYGGDPLDATKDDPRVEPK